MDNEPLHHCGKFPLSKEQGWGWEYVCQSCSYRARYIQIDHKLIILNPGDRRFKHVGNPTQYPNPLTRPMIVSDRDEMFDDVAVYLPENLVDQVESIITKLDF